MPSSLPPELQAVLRTDEDALGRAADDFGHLVHRRPAAVLEPRSPQDIARAVGWARKVGLRVAPRGQGHTAYGQAQVEDGVVVDLSGLDRIHQITPTSVTVDAGARWSAVVAATLGAGLAPPVLPDYVELSVGGTLSVGGISGSSFRHGALVDHVREIEVVTGAGDVATCSPARLPDLFEVALGGLGQCGIITRATLHLHVALPAVRVFRLPYADPADMTSDLRRLAGEGRFEYLLGVLAREAGGGWAASIEACASATGRADGPLLAGLRHLDGAEETEDRTRLQWVHRVAERVDLLQSLGRWELPHPWLDLFVPASVVDVFTTELCQSAFDAALDPLRILLYPLRRSRLRRPMVRLPSEEECFLVDVLAIAPADAATTAKMVDINRVLFDRNRARGGTLYPIGALCLDPQDWQWHFGPEWHRLVRAKRRFDPDGVLTPGPGIF